jgi:hypothetical protein
LEGVAELSVALDRYGGSIRMMKLEGRRLRARPLMTTALAALVLVVGACGSDDGNSGSESGSGGGGGTKPAADTTPAPTGGSDKEQVEATFARYIDAIYDGDYAAACAEVTAAELKAIKVISGGSTCEEQFRAGLKVTRPVLPKPTLRSVRVTGKDALGKVYSRKNIELYPLEFQNVAGTWKISNSLVTKAERNKAKSEGRL